MLKQRDIFAYYIDLKFKDLYPELNELDPPTGLPGIHMDYSIYANDGVYIGLAQIYNIKQLTHEGELGMSIYNKLYWHKGYGRDTLNQLINISVKSNLRRLTAKIVKGNKPAIELYLSCGFIQYGKQEINGHEFSLFEKLLT